MRVFAALVPSVEAVRDLDDALKPMRPLMPDMDWTSPDDWHLTFAYFGSVSLSLQHEFQPRLAGTVQLATTVRSNEQGSGRNQQSSGRSVQNRLLLSLRQTF